MSRRVRIAGLAMTAAAAILALYPVGAALAAEQDVSSDGIQISVVITPLQACVGACAGDGDLPATGGAFPAMVLWGAVALVAAGLLLALRHRLRPAGAGWRFWERSTPYDVVSGRRGRSSEAGLRARVDGSPAFQEGAGPDGEQGDPQCRRT
ncbi:LPXTG cell wall anchor domain-containing protein [Microbacterium sp. 4R-513]|uniref:LPXTG cell wall anchor domain-containing protein n=1 Tax=Microbacterium sp. 4R-513 TaxID=2567934 RepID=UPI0013E135A6|nr:LPXTG cell wall anchor domain-containing protein [Microbacterium sp. 4R-513]QIG39636.1 LPXTG cell wall anchor domain-containing protein [Microbacterium sp. 4R-513]